MEETKLAPDEEIIVKFGKGNAEAQQLYEKMTGKKFVADEELEQ